MADLFIGNIDLSTRVNSLLHHFMKSQHDTLSSSDGLSVPWDRVILVCADEIIASVDSDLWVSGFRGDEEEGCGYLPLEWLSAQADTDINSADTSARR